MAAPQNAFWQLRPCHFQSSIVRPEPHELVLIPVQVLLAVVRLPQHGSDLLITLNTPIFISGISAAAEHAGADERISAAVERLLIAALRGLKYQRPLSSNRQAGTGTASSPCVWRTLVTPLRRCRCVKHSSVAVWPTMSASRGCTLHAGA
jgi:hypothetical protein